MIDRDTESSEHRHETGNEGEAAHPAQAVALHTSSADGEETPQDGTDDTRWDTEEHSDAPGPTGTG